METEFQDRCPECSALIPEGTDHCPGCGSQLVFCVKEDCQRPYPADYERCPGCQTPNEMAALFQPAVERNPDPLPPPAAAVGPGVSQEALAVLLAQMTASGQTPAGTDPTRPNSSVSAEGPLPMPSPPGGMGGDLSLAMSALMRGGGSLSALTPGGDSCPIAVEIDAGSPPRRALQGMIRLRVTNQAGGEDCLVELVVRSDLWPQATLKLDARLDPFETHEFHGLKFIPRVAGAEEVWVTVTGRSLGRVPLGRWTGSYQMYVEDAPREQASSIKATGDVNILVSPGMGGVGLPSGISGLGGFPGLPGMPGMSMGFQTLALRPEQAFMRRLAAMCPEAPVSPPDVLALADASAVGPAQAVVCMREESSRWLLCTVVQRGMIAGIGRGEDPNVSWWLKPSPYDVSQHRRLSRQHLVFNLRDGRAWVTDQSTNGGILNDQPLVKGSAETLADGDLVTPANVVPLRVRLEAAGSRVHAVWLTRGDALTDRLQYVLTEGRLPVQLAPPVGESPAIWLAWTTGPDQTLRLAVQYVPLDGWQIVEADREVVLDRRWRLCWRPQPQPQPQEHYLRDPWAAP